MDCETRYPNEFRTTHDNLMGWLLSSEHPIGAPNGLQGKGTVAIPRLLITGGSGFLGRWVVQLAPRDWAVTGTYLTHPIEEPDVDWRRLNVREASAVSALMEDVRPSVVIHAAALNPGQASSFEAVNARGTENVSQAAERVGARLIHVSTDVLFDGRKGRSARGAGEKGSFRQDRSGWAGYIEEDPPNPLTDYGRSKALAEDAVRRSGVRAVIVRTSLLYGVAAEARRPSLQDTPWQQWDRQTRWVIGDLMAAKPVHLFTDERRCPTWVESLASALLELAALGEVAAPRTEVLHVAGAQSLSRYAFGVRLARFHGIDPIGITPALSRESGLNRPLDCTLDCSRAEAKLRTPLPGPDQVLQPRSPRPDARS